MIAEIIKTSQRLIQKPTNNLLPRYIVGAVIFAIFGISTSSTVQAQVKTGRATETSNLSIYEVNTEIGDALIEALLQGVSVGANRLSATNGFLNNGAVKISFPTEAKKMERALRGIGSGALVDNAITSINRAAEAAIAEARPIFSNAIKLLAFEDGTKVLFGKNDAATTFFERAATDEIMTNFKPIVAASLDQSGATKYWKDVNKTYKNIVKKPVKTDLVTYVSQQTIHGLFLEIAKEEANIRKNAKARTSPLLKRAFGFSDKQLSF